MSIRSAAPVLVVLLAILAGCGAGGRAAGAPAAAPATEAVTATTTSAGTAVATPAAPEKSATARKPKKGAPAGNEFAQMRRELGLTPDQEVAFSAKVAARDAALQAWSDGPDGQRLEAARSERTAATDELTRRSLDAEITDLNQAQWKVRTTYRSEVMQVLTADQQRAWASARLGDRLLSTYGKLHLDDAQRARVRAIASAAVAADQPAVVGDPYLTTALDPARLAAEQRVEAEVLTDAQRVTLAERRKKKAEVPALEAPTSSAVPPAP